MDLVHSFDPGDFLIFQLESGFALLRVLDVNQTEGVWHVAAYEDLFLDPEAADSALDDPTSLTVDKPHIALTNRAFESTQVARMRNGVDGKGSGRLWILEGVGRKGGTRSIGQASFRFTLDGGGRVLNLSAPVPCSSVR